MTNSNSSVQDPAYAALAEAGRPWEGFCSPAGSQSGGAAHGKPGNKP